MTNEQRKQYSISEQQKAKTAIANSNNLQLMSQEFKNTPEYKDKSEKIKKFMSEILEEENKLQNKYDLKGINALLHGYAYNKESRFQNEKNNLIDNHNRANKHLIALELNVELDDVKFDPKTNSFVVFTLDKNEPVKVFSTA
jgi:hypothetical protein